MSRRFFLFGLGFAGRVIARHLLAAGESSALMLGALLTIAATAIPWPMMSAARNPPATS